MKRQSYALLQIAMILLGTCLTFPPTQENHVPLNDIEEAERLLGIIKSKFGDTIPTATRMLLSKAESDLFYRQGQYQLAKERAENAYGYASRHGFNTELKTLQDRIDFYQKNLETRDQYQGFH